MPSCAVVGAGIAGLSCAYDLGRAGWDVVVLEATGTAGGKLAAGVVGDVELDVGVESLLARRPEALSLIDELGLGDEVVHPTPAQPRLWLDGAVVPLPRTSLGVPVDVSLLAGVLSPAGLARAAAEPSLPAPVLTADVAIGTYVAERFGDEVTDRLVEPLLGGVYAGRSRELSFAAVHPTLWERARTGGSLLAHAAASASAPAAAGPVFAGLRGGVHRLVSALAERLDVRTGVTVRSVRPGRVDGDAYDAVVLATPAATTGRLLSWLPGAAPLAEIQSASTAVITLVLTGTELEGSGLLVPPGQLPTVKALTYSSTKWPWVAARFPGAAVVRASVGRAGEAAVLQVDDAALVRRTLAELAVLPGWEGAELRHSHVRRWGGGLPQYAVGHLERIAAVEAAVAGVPGLAVCGAAYHGVGVPACIASGRAAAARIAGEQWAR